MTRAVRQLSVVLIDDHRLFRESLGALLSVHEGIEVVAEGSNGEEAVRLARQHLLRGASAYLIKTIGHHELVAAIRASTEHEQDLVTLSVSRSGLAGLTSPVAPMLSDREVEVLALVARACSNLAIATELRISEGTVKRHLSNINSKLGSTSRLDAVRRASRARLLPPGLQDD